MSEPILDPSYWAERLRTAPADALHHSIFRCPTAKWLAIEAKHRQILERHVGTRDFILDVGCGYGRLLTLMPWEWKNVGKYVGIDLSPDMIRRANLLHHNDFYVHNVQEPIQLPDGYFDLAVLISFRPMVKRNLGDEVWAVMESNVRKVAKKLLYLEYDETDEGSLE